MSRTLIFKTDELTPELFRQAAQALEAGAVAVLPTDTVYGMGTGVFCDTGVARIFEIKNRPTGVPLQILTGSVVEARRIAQFSAGAEKLAAAFWPGGLTLIVPPSEAGAKAARGFAGLGLRVPGNPFLMKLFQYMKAPLSCTSANLHGQPVLTTEAEVLETFDGKVDYIFLGGTLSPTASSVVDMVRVPRLLREGEISRSKLEQVLGEPFIV